MDKELLLQKAPLNLALRTLLSPQQMQIQLPQNLVQKVRLNLNQTLQQQKDTVPEAD